MCLLDCMKEKWRCQENDLQPHVHREVLCDACLLAIGEGKAVWVSERVAASAHIISTAAKGEHAAGLGANQLLIPDKSCIYSRRVVLGNGAARATCWKESRRRRERPTKGRVYWISNFPCSTNDLQRNPLRGGRRWAREVRDLIKLHTMGADVSKDFDLSAWRKKENRKEREKPGQCIAARE